MVYHIQNNVVEKLPSIFFETSGGCLDDSRTISFCKKLFAKSLKIFLSVNLHKILFLSSSFLESCSVSSITVSYIIPSNWLMRVVSQEFLISSSTIQSSFTSFTRLLLQFQLLATCNSWPTCNFLNYFQEAN